MLILKYQAVSHFRVCLKGCGVFFFPSWFIISPLSLFLVALLSPDLAMDSNEENLLQKALPVR